MSKALPHAGWFFTQRRASRGLSAAWLMLLLAASRVVGQEADKPSGPAAPEKAAPTNFHVACNFPFAVDYDLYPLPSTSYQPRLGEALLRIRRAEDARPIANP